MILSGEMIDGLAGRAVHKQALLFSLLLFLWRWGGCFVFGCLLFVSLLLRLFCFCLFVICFAAVEVVLVLFVCYLFCCC